MKAAIEKIIDVRLKLKKTFMTIQYLREKSGLQYDDMREALLALAKIQAIELQHGEPDGKAEHDKIDSNLANIPFINIQFHAAPGAILPLFYEYEYNRFKGKDNQVKQLQQQVDKLNKLNKEFHAENKTLLSKIANIKTVKEPDAIPDKININDSESWGVQIRSGKYLYAYKRFDKVHSVSLGKVSKFDLSKSIEKIKAYKQKNKLFTNK